MKILYLVIIPLFWLNVILLVTLSGCTTSALLSSGKSLLQKAGQSKPGQGLLDQAGSILDSARGCHYRYEEVCDWKEIPTTGTLDKLFHGKTKLEHVCHMEEVKHCPGEKTSHGKR